MKYPQSNQSEERRKKNEQDFKAFNVANRRAMEAVMDDESKRTYPLGLVCECSNPNCFERIELTVVERQRIRKDPQEYIIIQGHEDSEIEEVVGQGPNYVLVKKFQNT